MPQAFCGLQEELRLLPGPGKLLLQFGFVIEVVGVVEILRSLGTVAHAAVALHAGAGELGGILRVDGPQGAFPGALAAVGAVLGGQGLDLQDVDGVAVAVPGGVIGTYGVVALDLGGDGTVRVPLSPHLVGKAGGDGQVAEIRAAGGLGLGEGMLAGVERQNEEISASLTIQEVEAGATDYSAAVNVLKNAGCDVVIACMNQAPLNTLMNTMRDNNYNVDVVTSYVNASAATLGGMVDSGAITEKRMVYATAWLDATTQEGLADYTAFYNAMSAWELANGESGNTYALNSFAMAGYIAGDIFVQALKNLDAAGLGLDYANFAKIMEEGEYKIAMGGAISFAEGARLGVTSLALNKISLEKDASGNYALLNVSPIMSLEEVMGAVK